MFEFNTLYPMRSIEDLRQISMSKAKNFDAAMIGMSNYGAETVKYLTYNGTDWDEYSEIVNISHVGVFFYVFIDPAVYGGYPVIANADENIVDDGMSYIKPFDNYNGDPLYSYGAGWYALFPKDCIPTDSLILYNGITFSGHIGLERYDKLLSGYYYSNSTIIPHYTHFFDIESNPEIYEAIDSAVIDNEIVRYNAFEKCSDIYVIFLTDSGIVLFRYFLFSPVIIDETDELPYATGIPNRCELKDGYPVTIPFPVPISIDADEVRMCCDSQFVIFISGTTCYMLTLDPSSDSYSWLTKTFPDDLVSSVVFKSVVNGQHYFAIGRSSTGPTEKLYRITPDGLGGWDISSVDISTTHPWMSSAIINFIPHLYYSGTYSSEVAILYSINDSTGEMSWYRLYLDDGFSPDSTNSGLFVSDVSFNGQDSLVSVMYFDDTYSKWNSYISSLNPDDISCSFLGPCDGMSNESPEPSGTKYYFPMQVLSFFKTAHFAVGLSGHGGYGEESILMTCFIAKTRSVDSSDSSLELSMLFMGPDNYGTVIGDINKTEYCSPRKVL